MITISTTSADEARQAARLMRELPSGVSYGVYFLGRQVAYRIAGGQEILDLKVLVVLDEARRDR